MQTASTDTPKRRYTLLRGRHAQEGVRRRSTPTRTARSASTSIARARRAMLTRGFEILDANSDKSLTEAEYAKIVAPPMIKLNGG